MTSFKKFLNEDAENQLGVPMNEAAIVSAVESEIQKQMGLRVKLTSTMKLDASSNNAFKNLDVTSQISSKIFSRVTLTFSPVNPTRKGGIFNVSVGTRVSLFGGARPAISEFMEVHFDADGKIIKVNKF